MKIKASTIQISLLLFSLLSIAYQAQAEPDAPYGLLCELLRDPGQALITDPNPEFSWVVNDKRRGAARDWVNEAYSHFQLHQPPGC